MLKLYYSPGSCSLASHIALELAGADFDAVRIVVANGENRSAEYLKINPRAFVPALDVDGSLVAENTAILAYIGHRFPAADLIPVNDPLRLAQVHQLLSFFASSVHVAFAQFWRMERFSDDRSLHDAIRDGGKQSILRYFEDIETLAASGDWLCGDRVTVADGYPFVFYRWGRRIGVDMTFYPRWTAHTGRVLALPAVTRVLDREGLAASEFLGEAAR